MPKRCLTALCLALVLSSCGSKTFVEDTPIDTAAPTVVLILETRPEPMTCTRTIPEPKEKIYRDIPLSHTLQDAADKVCEEFGVEPDLLYAVMKVESGFQEDVRNGNCIGLMQIHTINLPYLEDKIGVTDLSDPMQNIRSGAYLLGTYRKKYSVADSLMAYNLGEGGAKKLWSQGIHETGYVRKVLEEMK